MRRPNARSEMLKTGVSETYVDAFCGRVPKSVLARHCTTFSPQKLEEILRENQYQDAIIVRSIDKMARKINMDSPSETRSRKNAQIDQGEKID